MKSPLWITRPDKGITKEAGAGLSRDVSKWPAEVMDYIYESYPYIPDENLDISFMKTDAEKGYGIGHITLSPDVRIVLIIKNFRAQPLELIIYKDALVPLTKAKLETILSGGKLGAVSKNLGPRDRDLSAIADPPVNTKLASASEAAEAALTPAELKFIKAYIPACAEIDNMPKVASAPNASHELVFRLTKQASDFGPSARVYVNTLGGPKVGTVFKQTISLDGEDLGKETFYGDKSIARMEKIAGLFVRDQPAESGDEITGWGMLAAQDKVGSICTEEFQVLGKAGKDTYLIKTASGPAGPNQLHFTDTVDVIETVDKTVYANPNWQFLKVAKETSIMPISGFNLKELTMPDSIILEKKGDCFSISSKTIGLKDIDPLMTDQEARLFLEQRYGVQGADYLMKTASDSGSIVYSEGKIDERPSLVSDAEWISAMKVLPYMTPDILKVAAIDKKSGDDTIDSVLNLGLIGRKIDSDLEDAIPHLETARDLMAKMLLASRMGAPIDPAVVKDALMSMDDLLRRMKQHLSLAKQ